MSRVLEAWLEGVHVGWFRLDERGTAFEYDEGSMAGPISLSLPRDGQATKRAAANFLDNLLPDNSSVRERMRTAYGAKSVETFDLLEHAGGDLAGGLILTPDGAEPPAEASRLDPAPDQEIAGRVASIKRDADAWVEDGSRARFSLGGTQGKFALARIGDDWYWSNSTVPSTHILKPGHPRLTAVELAEAAALRVARDTGIVRAPLAGVIQFGDQTAYVVERFDRAVGATVARRLHAEDLVQSTGGSPNQKYGLSARQAIELLHRHAPDQVMLFVEQLAFNVVIGNADAHGKNYSVLLRPDGVALSPLYDSVPTGIYPSFSQELAMPIAGAKFSAAVTIDHWRKLARISGLDEDETADRVTVVYAAVAERNDAAWESLPGELAAGQRDAVDRHARRILEPRSRRGAEEPAAGKAGPFRGKSTPASTEGSFREHTGSRPTGSLLP